MVLTSRGCAGVRVADVRMCGSCNTSAPACYSAVAPACLLPPLNKRCLYVGDIRDSNAVERALLLL